MRQKRPEQTKGEQKKMYGSCFVLANYSLWCYARPSPHGCQFQKASWLWVGLCVCFPPSMLGFCLVWAGLVCACSVFVSSYVFQSYWVLKTLTISLELSTILALTIFPPPLLERLLSLEVRHQIKTNHLGLSASKSLAPWKLSHCGALC